MTLPPPKDNKSVSVKREEKGGERKHVKHKIRLSMCGQKLKRKGYFANRQQWTMDKKK